MPPAASTRRPITASERPALLALGARVAELRAAAGMSRPELAGAELARSTVRRIEIGEQRTRRSTLERIVRALRAADPSVGGRAKLVRELVALAGDALALESEHADRVDRRRARRRRAAANRAEHAELAGNREREAKWRADQRQIERVIISVLSIPDRHERARAAWRALRWLEREHPDVRAEMDKPLNLAEIAVQLPALPSLDELSQRF